jgi:hypothetical protein
MLWLPPRPEGGECEVTYVKFHHLARGERKAMSIRLTTSLHRVANMPVFSIPIMTGWITHTKASKAALANL